MGRRRLRSFFACLVIGLFAAGPIAACICVDTAMADMPCCPDGAMGDAEHQLPDPMDADTSCEFVPGNPLSGSLPDLPATAANAIAQFPRVAVRGPPGIFVPWKDVSASKPPIYLTTLRLRH